jgi:uncharacterized membrane protein
MIARIVRWGVPGVLALAGLVLLAVSAGDETTLALGILFIGIGAIVAVWNAFLRLSFSSQEDRAREQRARRYFSRHGRWPCESR